ncbi:hypothetical protein STCU_09665 [Strigomonas culicis]|uniref:A distinct subfamily of CDD/CDA-like deaminases protein n=1 Tax=Strigomonas culicis TaxID=28005 RepID=S9TLD4_9TRYP|nr:hypothetical protein STCU_09665 [Strigomonas culicis]|eukprot:EPY19027.1 hypothetical protein STCU_09665 [Strigomonas culicis]
MCKKSDLTPPPVKYTLTAKKLNRCFFVCEKMNCFCERPHIQVRNPQGNVFWHIRLDTLKHTSILVSDSNQNRRIAALDVVPTAGYYFALGLMCTGAVPAVVPTLCRFNHTCRNGALCLYIHANVSHGPVHRETADVLLSEWAAKARLSDLLGLDDQENFFSFLDEEGIATVGDLQVLGVNAYEALAKRIPQHWATAFLVLSLLRTFDHKCPLTDALVSFPRVQLPIFLPPTLQRVGDLLALSRKELYDVPSIPPHALDACELIRSRFKTDGEYCVVNLSKEPPESFFSRVTNIIKSFSVEGRNAHCSWRKNDPTRPLVTSVFTYVDVNTCRCGDVSRVLNVDDDASVRAELDPVTENIGLPPRVWCTCARHYVVAVNYELSTPSGSRCSEQNAMGKLASLGVPTWSVREVFVYGLNPKKESNPLFPCGVCENMLQKVNSDISKHYGNEATLFMFDATKPHKVVYLPVAEISNRHGLNFKTFVAHDLRTPDSTLHLKP